MRTTLQLYAWGLTVLATALAGVLTAAATLVALVNPNVPDIAYVFLVAVGGGLATWLGCRATLWLSDRLA